MQKIPTIFPRDRLTHRLLNAAEPGTEWVFAGEGVATRKFDGTAVLIETGQVFKRQEWRAGRPAPAGFRAAQNDPDADGNIPGWVPVDLEGKEDRWIREALASGIPDAGTYELVGPKVQGNPEGFTAHTLVRHGAEALPDAPRDWEGLIAYLGSRDIEGIVWHHPDGRMAKIKKRDFGLARQPRVPAGAG